jgi:hypothetical protein
MAVQFCSVMRGLDPRIHLLRESLSKRMDCRVKPGNDGWYDPGSAAHRFASATRLTLRPGHDKVT